MASAIPGSADGIGHIRSKFLSTTILSVYFCLYLIKRMIAVRARGGSIETISKQTVVKLINSMFALTSPFYCSDINRRAFISSMIVDLDFVRSH